VRVNLSGTWYGHRRALALRTLAYFARVKERSTATWRRLHKPLQISSGSVETKGICWDKFAWSSSAIKEQQTRKENAGKVKQHPEYRTVEIGAKRQECKGRLLE
jgi:hypothetical protein